MYKSAHDISIYELTQCEMGNLRYLGRGLFKRRRLKKIQAQLTDLNSSSAQQDDLAVKANWIQTMELINLVAKQLVFATDDQKARVLAVANNLGLSLDCEKNEKTLMSYTEWVKKSIPVEPIEDAKKANRSPLDHLYGHLTYISLVLGTGRLDAKEISAAEFIRLNGLADEKIEATKSDRDGQ